MRTKNQHIVPKSYLRRFTYDGEHLMAFDKPSTRCFAASVARVANEVYFYDIEISDSDKQNLNRVGIDLDPQFVERGLSLVDNELSKLVSALLSVVRQREVITPQLRRAMAIHIAIQLTRTKVMRSIIAKAYSSYIQEVWAKTTGGLFVDECPISYNRENASLDQAKLMFNAEAMTTLSNVLCEHIWVLGVNNTHEDLYTSDHPVSVRSAPTALTMRTCGLAAAGARVMYPLDPKCILVLYDRQYFKALEQVDGETYPLEVSNVMDFNTEQVFSSNRQVYSRGDNFQVARRICELFPEIREPYPS